MTVDQQPDGWHVCFMHDWDETGVSVTNAIEQLATAVYREASGTAEQEAVKTNRMRAWFARWLVLRAPRLRRDRFHFYEHVPPNAEAASETFERVEMNFRDSAYRAPKWVGYEVIPRVIQSARLDCATDALRVQRQPWR